MKQTEQSAQLRREHRRQEAAREYLRRLEVVEQRGGQRTQDGRVGDLGVGCVHHLRPESTGRERSKWRADYR